MSDYGLPEPLAFLFFATGATIWGLIAVIALIVGALYGWDRFLEAAGEAHHRAMCRRLNKRRAKEKQA